MTDPSDRQLAMAFLDEHHPDAPAAVWAGSLSRGTGTATSDIDLVILYPRLERAWRETFAQARVIETFVHDPKSLQFFFGKDAMRGLPVLATMVAEGLVLRGGDLCNQAKALASKAITLGPPRWTEEDLKRERYIITDMRDDLIGEDDPQRLHAICASLYEALLAFHRRAKGLWTAKSKAIPGFLAEEEPALAHAYLDAFEQVFAQGKTGPLIALIDQILAPYGGPFYRWHALAPPHRDPD